MRAAAASPTIVGGSGPPYTATTVAMDTFIAIQIAAPASNPAVAEAAQRALGWFRVVEAVASRFDEASEVMRCARQVGRPVPVSPLLFQLLDFALSLARRSGGAFDPTVGRALELRGFNEHYVTGRRVDSPVPPGQVSYRDVELDRRRGTITLRKPLVIDLGAIAKGLAIDLAARELAPFSDFAVEAGGDLYVSGTHPEGRPWRVGIRHPVQPERLLCRLTVSGLAVCTSGNYERMAPDGSGHLLDPRRDSARSDLASVTVLAPSAMAADGLATAAFVLCANAGSRFLEREGAHGVFCTASHARFTTRDFPFALEDAE